LKENVFLTKMCFPDQHCHHRRSQLCSCKESSWSKLAHDSGLQKFYSHKSCLHNFYNCKSCLHQLLQPRFRFTEILQSQILFAKIFKVTNLVCMNFYSHKSCLHKFLQSQILLTEILHSQILFHRNFTVTHPGLRTATAVSQTCSAPTSRSPTTIPQPGNL
jgi:hypothetical protein